MSQFSNNLSDKIRHMIPSRRKFVFIIFCIVAIFILTIVIFIKINESNSALSKIQANYENIEVKKATFLDYDAQKITISSNSKKIVVQIIQDVDVESMPDVMEKLEAEITAVNEKRTYFNPYAGETVEYSVPDEFKYIKEESTKENFPHKNPPP